MTNYNEALFDCATECALRRKARKCKAKFRSSSCGQCRYYIGKYIDADPRHLELYMLAAEDNAGEIKATTGHHHFVFAILIGLCLFFAWSTYNDSKIINDTTGISIPNVSSIPIVKTVATNVQNVTTNGTPERQPTSSQQIRTTLNRVSNELHRGNDVNRDGLINCIDAAILFYQFYPQRDNVRIVVNRNPATDMHHLFNEVLIDGRWIAIEPQAVWAGHRSYHMRDVWGRRYNASLNRNVTNDYIRYVRR